MPFVEEEVMAAIHHLRTRVLEPSIFDKYLPNGVLYDVGWTLWEHPAQSLEGVGHANTLRVNSEGEYAATITRTALDSGALPPFLWEWLRTEHRSLDARVVYGLNNAAFRRLYNPNGAATSIVHQNTVFSPEPVPIELGRLAAFHPCEEFVAYAQAAAAESLHAYFNIGMANNDWAWVGYLAFNEWYAMEVRTRADQLESGPKPIGAYMPTSMWHIGATRGRFISAAGVSVPTPGIYDQLPWPHFVFDPTHPDVVELCNAHVRDFVRRFRCRASVDLPAATARSDS